MYRCVSVLYNVVAETFVYTCPKPQSYKLILFLAHHLTCNLNILLVTPDPVCRCVLAIMQIFVLTQWHESLRVYFSTCSRAFTSISPTIFRWRSGLIYLFHMSHSGYTKHVIVVTLKM